MSIFKIPALSIIIGLAGYVLSAIVFNIILLIGGHDAVAGFSGAHKPTFLFALAAIGFAPIEESATIWILVWMLQSKLKANALYTSIIATACMTISHGLSWGSLAVVPTFSMHSLIMHHARARNKADQGFFVIAGAHFTQNFISIIHARFW